MEKMNQENNCETSQKIREGKDDKRNGQGVFNSQMMTHFIANVNMKKYNFL